MFGGDAPEVATELEHIAGYYEEAEDFDQARETVQELLDLQIKRLGSDHWQIPSLRYEITHIDRLQKLEPAERNELNKARRLHLKAQELSSKGRYPEALDAAGQAAGIRKRLVGEEDRAYGGNLSVLGGIYQAQAEYAQAEPLFRQAIEIGKKTWGADHPQYGRGLTQLAEMYQVQADWVRAERLHLQTAEIERKAHGEQHHQYALRLIALANLYEAQADYARAEPLVSQAAEIIKKAPG